MGVNGKQKGNGFERKIANSLSDRFKEHTGLEQSFRRNIDSGSFFGGKNQQRAQTHDLSKASFGDIVVPENFKFSIECKFYKEAPSFNSLLKQDIKAWDAWLKQAQQDCKNSNLKMSVIIKYNNVEEIVILETAMLNALKNDFVFNLPVMLQYKDFSIITLSQFLSLPNDVFFYSETTKSA